ncbi:MAG: hypothetical protein DLM58_08795 [Pseudonocardiales bacterium]|nr:MAG: hypothetical protein DLM58_08795 [Pseudonocardiales bacterium]
MGQRLGIAGALLGDPGVLMFDEPVNGLDPEGIVWVRTLMRALAAEGRTVLVSSHLMSEMAITADRLIIIGRGRLIAEGTVEAVLHGGSGSFVRARSPQVEQLAQVLEASGAGVTRPDRSGPNGTVRVTGLTADEVGEIARTNGLSLHELSTQHQTLEHRYMELTGESVDYRATDADLVPNRRAN